MINLKVGICDDDMIYLNDIKSKLDQYIINNDVNISYHSYTKANDLLNNYKLPGKYDILFLDIEMPEINGLILAEKIKKIDKNVYIIFISNYPKYMQDSFRIHPFYYLVKPLSDDVFIRTMDDIISTIESEHRLVTLINTGEKEETINIKDIYFISVEDGKKGILCFHFFNTKKTAKGTLQEWSIKLSDYDFYQCHRGMLVNMIHIHYFESKFAIMDNGEKIPLSRKNEKNLKELYSKNIVRLKNL